MSADIKKSERVGEMDQQVKEPAANLSSVPKTHIMERENQLLKVVL